MELMTSFLLVIYILIFILQIVFLVNAVRRKTKKHWVIIFMADLIPMIIAYCLMAYFNNLPGYGFMPGFSYLGEILLSLLALVVYGIMLLVTIILSIVTMKK